MTTNAILTNMAEPMGELQQALGGLQPTISPILEPLCVSPLPMFFPLSGYTGYWTPGDNQQGPCVSVVLATGKWASLSCDVTLPYVCNQLPYTERESGAHQHS